MDPMTPDSLIRWNLYQTSPQTLQPVAVGELCFYCNEVRRAHFTSVPPKVVAEGLNADPAALQYFERLRAAYIAVLTQRFRVNQQPQAGGVTP